MLRIAVVLMNLGGPADLNSIEPFLINLFSDKDIFHIPFGQKYFAKIIAKLRTPKVAEHYKLIGGSSPIKKWTEKQRKMLEKNLISRGINARVFSALRYSPPFTKDVVAEIARNNYGKIILLPLYPHYSYSTTRSSFNQWQRIYKGNNSRLIFIESYHLNEKYIEAVLEKIKAGLNNFSLAERKNVVLVFSAHGTPISMQKAGDPYSKQIKATVEKIIKKLPDLEYEICYQSKVGPLKWLTPNIKETIDALVKKGRKQMLVIPISFVSDHFETLYELNIFYKQYALKIGAEQFRVTEGLNDSKLLIDALADEVIKKLEA